MNKPLAIIAGEPNSISPDHGVGENIVGKNIANSKSLIESIKFYNNIK